MEGSARTLVVTYLVLQNDERESFSPAHAWTGPKEEQGFLLSSKDEQLASSSMILRKQRFWCMILSKGWDNHSGRGAWPPQVACIQLCLYRQHPYNMHASELDDVSLIPENNCLHVFHSCNSTSATYIFLHRLLLLLEMTRSQKIVVKYNDVYFNTLYIPVCSFMKALDLVYKSLVAFSYAYFFHQ